MCGEQYDYTRYTGEPGAADHPFALQLTSQAALKGLYLDAEAESGYLRDRNVFGEPITIEDTMTVTRATPTARCSPIAWSPIRRGKGCASPSPVIRGRIEMDIEESITHLLGEGEAKGRRSQQRPLQTGVHPPVSSRCLAGPTKSMCRPARAVTAAPTR